MVHSFIHFHSLHLSHSPSSSLTVPQDHTLLSLVMSHTLSLRSLLNSMQVCSMWHQIIKSNTCNAAWKDALLFTLSGVSSLLFLSLTIFIYLFLYYFGLMFCILECYSTEKYESLPNGSLVQDHAIDWAVQTKEVLLFSFLFTLPSSLFPLFSTSVLFFFTPFPISSCRYYTRLSLPAKSWIWCGMSISSSPPPTSFPICYFFLLFSFLLLFIFLLFFYSFVLMLMKG